MIIFHSVLLEVVTFRFFCFAVRRVLELLSDDRFPLDSNDFCVVLQTINQRHYTAALETLLTFGKDLLV